MTNKTHTYSYSTFWLILLLIGSINVAVAEGSRTLAPNYADTSSLVAPGATNNDFAWLEHDGFGGANDNFLDPSAPANERLYIRLKAGETLRYGIRRIPVRYAPGSSYSNSATEHNNHEYLTIVVYDSDGNVVNSTTLTNDNSPNHGAWLDAGQPGVIGTVASSLIGPQFTYNSNTYNAGGYTPIEYTNNDPQGDQDFYIAFIQDDGGTNDIDERSWYDLWDFSVYDGNEEKPGRMHCTRWSLTAQYFDNLLADEVNFYVRVPSTIDGGDAGNYIKEVQLGGLNPFSLVVYANSQGTDGTDGDTNGDGITDFQDYRMSVTNEIAEIEYDLFINNPDVDLYPTTVLPTISITDANVYCNSSTGGGAAAIYFESNQVGQIAVLVDLDGTNGYQDGTEDVIIETEITTEGEHVIRWDGLNGFGATVPSGTNLTISGRFTSGPIHVPLWDVEENDQGMNMLDIRPNTSFNLIYWDDSDIFTGVNPEVELDGTNTSLHTWTSGDDDLINTWSFGYYQINTQNITFEYSCDADGDGVADALDEDSDNDGVPDTEEGDHDADTDGDGIPDYLDPDVDGDGDVDANDNWADINGDGINDNFDYDLDGIPNSVDLDSDNDGITDLVEAGGTDSDNDGKLDGFTDVTGRFTFSGYSISTGCSSTVTTITTPTTLTGWADDQTRQITLPFAFEFYGTTFAANSSLYLNSNGWVSFNNIDPGTDWRPDPYPSGTYPNTIAFHHVDMTPNSGGTITYGTNGTAPNRVFLIYLQNVPFYGQNGTLTAQLQLHEGTNEIRVVTTNLNPDGGGGMTQGLNQDGTTAITVTGRNDQNYTIGSPECQSFTPTYVGAPNGVDDTLDSTPLPNPDTDGDGLANFRDLDSDNDGIVDTYEAGGTANTSTGQIADFTDSDGNGLNDQQQIVALALPDSDGDGFDDYLDIDSDNDGIRDYIEAQQSSLFIDFANSDTNSNGLVDVYDPNIGGTILTPVDTDSDGLPDYTDTDADNDGVVDLIEGWDSDQNGISDLDTNADGIIDDTDACAGYTTPGLLRAENADFENGLNGLTGFSGDVFVTSDAQSGVSAVLAGPAAGGTYVSEYIPVEAGQTFQFTGYAKITGSPGYTGIGITFWDEDISTRLSEPQAQVLATTYTLYTVNATAPGGAAFVEVWTYKSGATGTLTFDNFSLILTSACSGTLSDDSDGDGLLDLFENYNTPLQNTDGADESDWQDDDDDNDGSPTAGEDVNGNGYWSDDFTEGGGTIPDYLFRGDFDGDAIADKNDADSDNDGITDAQEANGEAIDPSGDDDSDGIPNYRDAGIAASLTSATDANGDGVFDVFDSDMDGSPDFLDLDSDNDGIWDAIEAYEGSIPNGLNETTGQFELNDPDNDGLMNYVDSSPAAAGGNSTLANPDSDGDGVKDYVDIDSDGDGIPDIIESQSTADFIALTNVDTDGDGIDDAFDPDNGGTLILPINTDGLDLQDYLDLDSDNDNVLDIVEGNDANNDGFGDWDDNTNGIADEADFIDSDGDGLPDAFDNVTLGTVGNETGSNAALQNTDGLDQLDFRDTDDDADGILTEDEDTNSNGNYQDDKTQGQGAANIPNYLFNGDYDKDGIADALDTDSDNDGVPDSEEDGGQSIDPSGDEDGDGIPNFRDTDDATVIAGLTSTADTNGDGVYDVYDHDMDGIPDFRDADSDNDGVPDLVEAGGTDADGDGRIDGLDDDDGDGIPNSVDADFTGGADVDDDGIDDAFDFSVAGGTDTDGDDIIDSADTDIDGDGLPNTYDTDNGGTALIPGDTDGDGINDLFDLDTDNDGIPDLVEAGGTDSDGNGKVDDATDSDNDGLADVVDSDNGGTALPIPDTDYDGIADFKDLDSDNDGITDAIENGGADTNSDGLIDGYASDTDGDGLADVVDPDNGGSPIANVDTDGDGIDDYLDLDSDNDGIPDLVEAGGVDTDFDGRVDDLLDADLDGIPYDVDVDQTGGTDADGDGIDDAFDASITGGNDNDNDGIDDRFDMDKDGNGYSDAIEANPLDFLDTDGDGNKNFRDIDSDNDGIVDIIEFGGTADPATGTISGFTDTDGDGFNDAQDGYIGAVVNGSVTPITPLNTDSGSEPASAIKPDYLDIDSDNDGIVDLIEAQSKATFIALSGVDANNNGLDDAFDPNLGATLLTPVATDGGNADYLDTDSDADGVLDRMEGSNADKNLYADWDADNDGNFDDAGYNTDVDEDGLLDIYDNVSSTGSNNITGSNAAVQDTDLDGIWDFQDVDDDNDGITTASESTSALADPNGITPDYLYGDQDSDNDGVDNDADLDADNDGVANASEDGGTGIDPGADTDADGLYNYQDFDIDGDAIANTADTNTSGINTTGFTDSNGDGVIDQFDKDLDGIPDFKDLDSDNDGIPDILEFGLTDANQDGTLDEGAGITDTNANGLHDTYDPACDGASTNTATTGGTNVGTSGTFNNTANILDANNTTYGTFNSGAYIDIQLEGPVLVGNSIDVRHRRNGGGGTNTTIVIRQYDSGQNLVASSGNITSNNTVTTTSYTVVTSDAHYIRIENTGANTGRLYHVSYTYTITNCSGGSALSPADFDSDGIDNYLDLDADGDGIPDNIEAQSNLTYKAPVLVDSDGDGIMDIYDQDAGGALAPVNSDSNGNPDYLDTDSDDDGIPDVVEAWDSDMDGFGDWDTNGNNDPTDESGYGSDVDADGISYLFDSNSGRGTVANITGSSASLQDTDADDTRDFRDTDDDNDGINTSAEDFGDGAGGASDGDWTNDFTQGGLTVPDYLFSPDNDGDGIIDAMDLDPNNDGISIIQESNGTLPFGDEDGDNIYNYLDSDYTGFVDTNNDGIDDRVDHDRDGVPDFFDLDSDNDGISDLLEVGLTDGDGDGTLDQGFGITDANNNGLDDSVDPNCATTGSASWIFNESSVGSPFNAIGGINGTNATFNNAADFIILDMGVTLPGGTTITVAATVGLGNQIRLEQSTDGANFSNTVTFTNLATTYTTSGGARYIRVTSPTANTSLDALTHASSNQCSGTGTAATLTNTDGDALANYLDLDSDNDGLTDNREAQPSAGFIVITATDTDGDGLKDVYDADNGGTYIVPINSDSDGDPDYLDTDSDDDNVLDVVEGFDANKNGFSDLDTNQDGDLSDETGYGLDTDGDGLENIFDNYSGTGIANIKGSKSKRQDTDGDGTPDYRDDEDDSDGIDTSAEDTSDGAGGGADGIYYNDKSQGGGATPDYLFFNDTDDDGIADGLDLDSDNDGIIDDDEAAGVTYTGASGPFDDDDNDGLFNYRDADATNFVDDDGDGIDDRVDADSDGIPNFFDLDSDNDGIPDGVEANRGTLPTGQNTNGQFPPSATDVDDDGLADNVDGGSVSTLANPDTDGDGIPDFLDLDSDSDGITDLLEAGGNDYNGDGKLDSFGDTDGDGLGNSVDVDNGGTPLTIPNSDGTGRPNYIDADSEDDGTPDFEEGFYEAGPTNYRNSYINRVTAYNAANVATSNTLYPTGDTSPADGTPDYLNDSDGDGIPNLLDPQSAYFLDDDGDGLINLFDPDQNGDFYGNVNGVPDRDSDGNPNILDGSDVPLPLDFISFSGTALNENVTLKWTTANEVNVSHFEVLHSTAGSQDFKVLGTVQAVNIKELVNDYQFTHQNAPAGYNFYRIREVDLDGFEGFTEIINVVVEASNISWTLYPNPAQDHLSIRSTVVIPDSRIMIMDVTGRTLYDQHISFESKAAELDLSRLGAGVYHIIIELPDSKKSFRVIKQ